MAEKLRQAPGIDFRTSDRALLSRPIQGQVLDHIPPLAIHGAAAIRFHQDIAAGQLVLRP